MHKEGTGTAHHRQEDISLVMLVQASDEQKTAHSQARASEHTQKRCHVLEAIEYHEHNDVDA